ncbi:MAG: myxococcus cysteine-rich repeat containing protein [Byssovorax sp.]
MGACGKSPDDAVFGTTTSTTTTTGTGGAGGSTSTTGTGGTGGTPLTCGNGTREGAEDCDGKDLGGKTCADLGYVSPPGLACDATCHFDAKGCVANCGNNVVEPGEQCDDGNAAAGDGCSKTCTIEGATCATAIPISLVLGTQTIHGTTAGAGAHTGTDCMGSAGPDRLFAVTIFGDGFLTASLTRGPTNYNSILYASASCDDAAPNTSILCANSYDVATDLPLNGGEVISFKVKAAQVIYLFVDGFKDADSGDFELVLDLSTGISCDDPVPIPIAAGAPMTLLGTTEGAGLDATAAGCAASSANCPDVVYQITRPTNGSLEIQTPASLTTYNSVLHARKDCKEPATELQCANELGNSGGEMMFLQNLIGGTPVYLWVDGSSFAADSIPFGNYGLVITP